MTQAEMLDVLVLGGGLAGVAAARRLLDSGAKVELVELGSDVPLRARFSIDPTAVNDREMSGGDLDRVLVHSPAPHTLRRHFHFLAASKIPQCLRRDRDSWRLLPDVGGSEAGSELLTARALLFCPSAEMSEQWPLGAAELAGRGVSMCGWSDAAFFEGRRVAVVGDGDRALETALFASEFASEVLVYMDSAPAVRRASLRGRVAKCDRVRIVRGAHVVSVHATQAREVAGIGVAREGVIENIECAGVFFAQRLTISDAAAAFASVIRSEYSPGCAQVAGGVTGLDDDDHAPLVDGAFLAAARLL